MIMVTRRKKKEKRNNDDADNNNNGNNNDNWGWRIEELSKLQEEEACLWEKRSDGYIGRNRLDGWIERN